MSKKDNLKGITVKLSKEKSEQFFHSALCNGLGQMQYYGLDFIYDKSQYKVAKETLSEKIKNGLIPIGMSVYGGKELTDKDICYEDVLIEILRNNGKLTLEGNGETKSITLSTVHKMVQKTDLRHLIEYINDTGGDAITADVIIQTMFFGKIIYG